MSESAESGSNKQVSLKRLASKNSMLSLLLFAVLIVIIVVASLRDRASMDVLAEVYDDQFRVEQFKATLSNVMLPLNDFTMTAESSNFSRIRTAVSEYKTSYQSITAIPRLGEQDKAALAKVDALMNEVMNIANDVADAKIPANQAAQVTLLSQNLVLAAQKKLESIVKGMEAQLATSTVEQQQKSTLQLYILLGFIVFIVLLLEFLNRRLLKHALTVSKMSSSLAESAGDIVLVNKMQASTTDQQVRFMEKVIKGLELIADSGKEISTVIAGLEKNSGMMQAFAKGGARELEESMATAAKLRANMHASDGANQRQESGQILKPLQQIQDVADEAHLLALNASIDGAEQGVSSISNEVQHMAERIREYSEEIRSTIPLISNASSQTEEERLAYIDKSVDLARQTADLLFRIEAMSEKNSQAASAVVRVSHRQNERNQKILQALQHISELLNISGNKAQAYSDASARLSEASESLQHIS